MPFDTLNPFSAVYEYRAAAADMVGLAFKETNIHIRIPFFEGNKVIYKVISGINQAETEYSLATIDDSRLINQSYFLQIFYDNSKFLTYAYTKTLIDQFQACSKHNNELWWDTYLVSRLAFLAARNTSVLKPVLVIPKNEILQPVPSISICLYGTQPFIDNYAYSGTQAYSVPPPYAYAAPSKITVMRDCPLNFSTDVDTKYDMVEKTSWGPIAVNLDHGYSFVYTFDSMAYVFNIFQALKNMTTDVIGGTAVVLSAEQVTILEGGGSVTLPMEFNFVFYGETVEFTCNVILSKLVAEVQYTTLVGTTSNGLMFKGVDSSVSNYVYYTNDDKTYGSSTLTFTIVAVLMSNHCLITFSDNITMNMNFLSSYHVFNNIGGRHSSASVVRFMRKAVMVWIPNSSPQNDDADPDLLYEHSVGYGDLALNYYICTNRVHDTETLFQYYTDQLQLHMGAGLYFNRLVFNYSSEDYYYSQPANDESHTVFNKYWAQQIIIGVGRDMSVSLICGINSRNNDYYADYPMNSQQNCTVNVLKSMTITCDENGNLSAVDTTSTDTGGLGPYGFGVWFGYTPATETYVSVGSAPFVAINGVTTTEFGYGTGYQYSEQCDQIYQVYTSTLGDFSFYYAPIETITPTATFGASNLGFSLTKHDDRSCTIIDNSTYYAVTEALQYGDRVKITNQNEWFDRTTFAEQNFYNSSFAVYGADAFNQGRKILANAYFGNNRVTYFINPNTNADMYNVVSGLSYTINGNVNTVVNCPTQGLQDAIDANYPTGIIRCKPPSLDVLPVADIDQYSGLIYPTITYFENIVGVCDFSRRVSYAIYYNSSGANVLLSNYQNYYRPHYFSTKSISSKKQSSPYVYGTYTNVNNTGPQFLALHDNVQMLNYKRYYNCLEGNYYSVVVAYRVKNNDIVGVAIGAYKKLQSKGQQFYNLQVATTQEAWNNVVNAVLDDWMLIHNYNMPDNFIELMPIICLQASVVHIFEDFDTRYLQNL